jgi:hypothetical protein
MFHQRLKEMAKIKMRLVIKITLNAREVCLRGNRIESPKKP